MVHNGRAALGRMVGQLRPLHRPSEGHELDDLVVLIDRVGNGPPSYQFDDDLIASTIGEDELRVTAIRGGGDRVVQRVAIRGEKHNSVNIRLKIGDDVLIVSGSEREGVSPDPASESVVSQAARKEVIARTAPEQVVVVIAIQSVIARATVQGVIATIDVVIPIATVQTVGFCVCRPWRAVKLHTTTSPAGWSDQQHDRCD